MSEQEEFLGNLFFLHPQVLAQGLRNGFIEMLIVRISLLPGLELPALGTAVTVMLIVNRAGNLFYRFSQALTLNFEACR